MRLASHASAFLIALGLWSLISSRYGLGISWERSSQPLRKSIETSDPERALRNYHDGYVAGGTLDFRYPKFSETKNGPPKRSSATSGGTAIVIAIHRVA